MGGSRESYSVVCWDRLDVVLDLLAGWEVACGLKVQVQWWHLQARGLTVTCDMINTSVNIYSWLAHVSPLEAGWTLQLTLCWAEHPCRCGLSHVGGAHSLWIVCHISLALPVFTVSAHVSALSPWCFQSSSGSVFRFLSPDREVVWFLTSPFIQAFCLRNDFIVFVIINTFANVRSKTKVIPHVAATLNTRHCVHSNRRVQLHLSTV